MPARGDGRKGLRAAPARGPANRIVGTPRRCSSSGTGPSAARRASARRQRARFRRWRRRWSRPERRKSGPPPGHSRPQRRRRRRRGPATGSGRDGEGEGGRDSEEAQGFGVRESGREREGVGGKEWGMLAGGGREGWEMVCTGSLRFGKNESKHQKEILLSQHNLLAHKRTS